MTEVSNTKTDSVESVESVENNKSTGASNYKREFPQNRYTVLSILIFPLKKIPLTSLVYLNFH